MSAPSSKPQIDGHLILVGLPGAGKTTIGRNVARKLGRPFLDFDLEIEKRSGLLVRDIFARQGEQSFRRMEQELTRELAAAPPMTLSPGGGWITNPGVVELLRPPAKIVHLKISPAGALMRLSRSRVVRPLLAEPDPAARIQALWESRRDLYNAADLIIDVELVDSKRVTDSIVALAHELTPGIG